MKAKWSSKKGYSKPGEVVTVLEFRGDKVKIHAEPDPGEPKEGFSYWVNDSELEYLPVYGRNPKGRRMATAKQIAWRKKFAAMAKAGTLRKGKKRRAKNPRRSPIRLAKTTGVSTKAWKRHAKIFPAPKRKRAHKVNPVHSGFAVNIGVGGSRMHKIATFRDLTRAKEYATALHRKTGRRVSVTH